MAWSVDIVRDSTTYNISNGSPFSVDSAELGGASVRVIEESGPYQDGATHLDDRLEPDTFALKINVVGASASTLDGYRDTLNKIFKPIRGVPITIKITRDDGSVRQLDTWRTGKLAIPLIVEQKAGNLHRAVVMLRASEPTWYDPTEQTESFSPPTGNWWLAAQTIGSADVLTHVESPTQGQLWDNAGSVTAGSAFTIAFRSGSVTRTAFSTYFPFEAIATNAPDFSTFFAARNPTFLDDARSGELQAGGGSVLMGAGTQNYFVISNGGTLSVYRGTTLIATGSGTPSAAIPGTASGTARWRSLITNDPTYYWPEALPYAAAYNIALDSGQLSALDNSMTLGGGTVYSKTVTYAGDVDSYPVITMRGAISDPVITNQTTGDVLDFTGGTLGTADVWVIDLRYGRKSVLSGTVSKESYLSTDSDLTTFRLVPDPTAPDGENVITVASSDAGTAGSISLALYKRYMGY